jgi:hypothetical protein
MGGEDGEWLKGIEVGSEAWCGGWRRALGFVDLRRFFSVVGDFLGYSIYNSFFSHWQRMRLFYLIEITVIIGEFLVSTEWQGLIL